MTTRKYAFHIARIAFAILFSTEVFAQSTAFPPTGTIPVGPPVGQRGWSSFAPGSIGSCIVSDGTQWAVSLCPSGSPTGAAGGDLTGLYPNPTLAAGASGTNLGIYSIKDYTEGGTANDTTGVQSAFTACGAAGGCKLVCARGVTYTIDTVTVSSNTKLDASGCIFQQRTAGNSMFTMTSVSNISFDNGTFYSVTPTVQTIELIKVNGGSNVRFNNNFFRGSATVDTGYAAANNHASAILIYGNSSNIYIFNNNFYRFTYLAIYAVQSTDIKVDRNIFRNVALGPRFRQIAVGSMDGNIFDTSLLYSLNPTDNQFSVVFGMDTSAADPDFPAVTGYSSKISVSNNIIKDAGYAQGVLVHAGEHLSINGNTCDNVAQCIGITPYTTTDNINYITVNGNNMDGSPSIDMSGLSSPSDVGIIIQSGGANPEIHDVTVVGNVVVTQNRTANDAASGCIMFGKISRLVASSNVMDGCGGSGIIIASPLNGVVFNGNHFSNTITVGGENNGIYFRTAASGARANMVGNYFQDQTNGVKYATGITITNIQNASSLCVTITNCTLGP